MKGLSFLSSNKYYFIFAFIAVLGAVVMLPNYFQANLQPLQSSSEPWMSLDPSWNVGLNYMKIKNFTWGSDCAFTYGPLGYLSTRVGWGENRFSFLVFDIFIFLNFFCVFFFSLCKTTSKIVTGVLILLVLLIVPVWIGTAYAIILLCFLVFWISLSLENPKPVYYLFQISIFTILFFLKFNTGLIALPLFVVGLLCTYYYSRKKIIILYFIAPFVIILCASVPFNVDLISYTKSGFEMVAGYNDIMFLENQIPNSLVYLIVVALGLFVILFSNIFSQKRKQRVLIFTVLFIFGTTIFVLYKQGFVRADKGHIKDFFIYILLLILCNTYIYTQFKFRLFKIIFLIIIFVPVYFLVGTQSYELASRLKPSESTYLKNFSEFDSNIGLYDFKKYIQIPKLIKSKIGQNSIDIFPWNLQSLLENNLNYLPRPAFQSYSAYTPFLENLNFNHFNSKNAPKFVIYDFTTIDGRYPLFDESKVNLCLILNYNVVEQFEYDNRKLLLLKKKSDFKSIQFKKIKEYAMMIGTPIVPQKNIFYEIGIYHNLSGKITSMLQHAPQINLEISTAAGLKVVHRTSKLLLETGVFSNNYVSDINGFESIIKNENTIIDINYYKFVPLDMDLFSPKIRVTEFKIIQ